MERSPNVLFHCRFSLDKNVAKLTSATTCHTFFSTSRNSLSQRTKTMSLIVIFSRQLRWLPFMAQIPHQNHISPFPSADPFPMMMERPTPHCFMAINISLWIFSSWSANAFRNAIYILPRSNSASFWAEINNKKCNPLTLQWTLTGMGWGGVKFLFLRVKMCRTVGLRIAKYWCFGVGAIFCVNLFLFLFLHILLCVRDICRSH